MRSGEVGTPMKHHNALVFSILAVVLLIFSMPAYAEMTVRVLDVGQGDSILVSSAGHYLLFDAGPSLADVTQKVQSYGVTKLDYFITSHPDADHIGGAAKVISTIPIGKFADSGATHTTKTYENMIQALVNTKTPYVELSGGESFTLGDIKVDVLAAGGGTGDENSGSVVLKLIDGYVTMILPGDREQLGNWPATILVVPHHGSAGSNIEAVKPKVAIISVGAANRYNHPTQSTLSKIKDLGAELHRTDQEGTITVTSTGSSYSISSGSGPVVKQTQTYAPPSTPMPRTTTKAPTAKPTKAAASSGPCSCTGDLYNCKDFSSRSAAQSCYDYCMRQTGRDVHKLDNDRDGRVCESMK